MQSEVRKVLDGYNSFEIPLWLTRLDAAERADAARREEPVQAVAELVAKWGVRYVPIDAANMVRDILAELNTIIATKPDTVENRQAAASGPVHDVTPADAPKETLWMCVTEDGKTHKLTLPELVTKTNEGARWQEIRPSVENRKAASEAVRGVRLPEGPACDQWRVIRPVVEPAVAERVYEIATRAVRDAMPDVIEAMAATFGEDGFPAITNAFREHAAKLRKDRGA